MSDALRAAILDLLAAGPRTARDLADETSQHYCMVRSVLASLSKAGAVACGAGGYFEVAG